MDQSELQPSRRGEFAGVLLVALVVVFFTALPYIFALFAAPPGTVFTGLLANPLDGNTYLSKMMQGDQNGPVFRLIYTSEDQQGAFLFGFYLFLGMIAGKAGLAFPLVFHLARSLAGLALLIGAFYAFGFFLRNREQQWLAYLIFAVGSGFGWIGIVGGYLAPDFTIPETLAFTAILTNPHFPLGLLLTIGVFALAVRSVTERRRRLAVYAGMLSLVLGFVQPNMLVTVFGVLGVWVAWGILAGFPTGGMGPKREGEFPNEPAGGGTEEGDPDEAGGTGFLASGLGMTMNGLGMTKAGLGMTGLALSPRAAAEGSRLLGGTGFFACGLRMTLNGLRMT